GRVLVVAPAALRRDWVPALRRLADGLGVARTSGLGAWRRGAGSLLTDGPIGECTDADLITGSPAALPHDPGERERAGRTGSVAPALPGREARAATRAGTPFLAWVSHARLSRGTHGPERLYPLDLVVVDEAHAFRSPGTRRYRALAALCRGARVVLLTATPVNNSVSDLYFQLRLFAGDGDFRDVGVAHLGAAFRAAAGDAAAARSVTAVLREVMIRRTRPFLR